MKLNTKESLGSLVTQYPVLRNVFEKHRLDYCCNGKQSLQDAAQKAGLNIASLHDELVAAIESAVINPSDQDWTQADAESLCRYIVDRHHGFMRRQLPRIRSLFSDVRTTYGATHGKLIDTLRRVFDGLAAEIEMHLKKEEQILFPYIEQFDRHLRHGEPLPEVHCGSVQNPIRQMEYEHDKAGAALEKLRQLSGDYQPPADACQKFKALYDSLAELEQDLHEHIHLENNILFLKAVKMEQKVSH